MDDLFSFAENQQPASFSPNIRIAELRKSLSHHDKLYYDQATPEISDAEYDQLFRELETLEKKHPEYHDPNSPTQRVGGKALEGFETVQQMKKSYVICLNVELVYWCSMRVTAVGAILMDFVTREYLLLSTSLR